MVRGEEDGRGLLWRREENCRFVVVKKSKKKKSKKKKSPDSLETQLDKNGTDEHCLFFKTLPFPYFSHSPLHLSISSSSAIWSGWSSSASKYSFAAGAKSAL